MYRILVVEDDADILAGIKNLARMWNMEVYGITDFRDVLSEFAHLNPHLVLMDIGLPAFDGYYWCTQIRSVSKVPIIFISSASENMNIVMAMNMGGDDFIAKPFDPSVLIAKIQALLRRTYDFGEAVQILAFHGAILNLGDHVLHYGDEQLELAGNEFKILYTLLRNKGSVVSREKLMEALWETDSFVDENTLNVNVNRLRKRLDGIGLKDLIHTKFGVGYLIED